MVSKGKGKAVKGSATPGPVAVRFIEWHRSRYNVPYIWDRRRRCDEHVADYALADGGVWCAVFNVPVDSGTPAGVERLTTQAAVNEVGRACHARLGHIVKVRGRK